MASTSVVFDILANDRASSKFDALGRSVDRSGGHLSKFSSLAKTAAKATLLMGAAAGGVAIKLGIDAVKAASDLGETLNKSQVIFGKHAGAMEAWAERADTSLGLSKAAALGLTSGFADMFDQIGFGTGAAADMSREVAQLSADLGSFNNLETADVAERMSAAFRGEFDSLQALIPNINAARVEQVALARTGKDSADALTAQEKAAATLAIVQKDGAKAQGDFARTSDGLANRSKILKAELANLQAEIGTRLLPVVNDVAGALLEDGIPALEKLGDKAGPAFDALIDAGMEIKDAVQPAVEEIAEALGHLAGEGEGAGKMFDNVFVPALKATSDVVAGVVDFIDDLPGPVKDLGVQAGIAALVLPKLTGALDAAKGSAVGMVTGLRDAETRTAALASAAKTAAGIGGMLALAHSAQESNDALAVFEKTAGGAAAGFAIGGPWGAAAGAIGGVVSSMFDLRKRTRETQDAAYEGMGTWEDYAATLGDVTAAITEQTREMVYQKLQQSGLLDQAGELGISQQTLLNGVLGQEGARRRLTEAIAAEQQAIIEHGTATKMSREEYAKLSDAEKEELDAQGDALEARQAAIDAIRDEIGAVRKSVREKVNEIAVVKRIPRRVVTEFMHKGVAKNIGDLRRLAHQYDLTPRQVRTIVKAANVDVTRAELRRLIADLKEADKQRPKPRLDADERPFRDKSARILASLRELDRQQVNPKTSLSLDEYYRRRAQLLTSLRTIPDEYVNIWVTRRDGSGGGGGRGGGSGSSGRTVPSLVDPRMVARSVTTSTRGAGNIFRGLGAGLIRQFAIGINGNAGQAEAAVERMMKAIKKAVDDKKITEAAAKRMREAVQAMAREADQGRAMLQKRADFASTLRDAFRGELNLGEIVSSETFAGIGSITGGVSALANRLEAFAGQLSALRKAGIPRSLIGEIASLGSDQGSQAAAAILAGSSGDRSALASAYNSLQHAAGLASGAAANAVHGTVQQIKQDYHVTIHVNAGGHNKQPSELGKEMEQALLRWSREQGRPLQFKAAT